MNSNKGVKISPYSASSDCYEYSVLNREWKKACLLAWTIFCVYEILMFMDSQVSQQPLCSHNSDTFGYFYTFANIATLSGFAFTCIVLISRIMRSISVKERISRFIAFNVASMSLITAVLDIIFQHSGICIDSLGVATPAALWGEWIACGVLLIFFTLAMVDKKTLNRMDWIILFTFFLTIMFGFITIIPQPLFLAYFWFVLSFLSFLPTLYLPWYVSRQEEEKCDVEAGVKYQSIRKEQRFYLALWLTIAFPLFPMVYMVAAFDFIGPGDTIGMFLLLSVILKGFLLVVIMDEFVNALSDAREELSKEMIANQLRRAFLKYIFHEVRTPLNSMVMGLELLKKSNHLDASEIDLLSMMHSSTDFMSETLNNVLSLQKMEEGKVQLEMSSFSITDSIAKVSSCLQGAQVAKNLHLESSVDVSVPDLLSGDRYRVEHVLSNLLSNAIKFSPENGAIRIHVTAEAKADAMISVTVSITDEGPGISAEDQKSLFESFFQIRPNQLQQGQGSGLGLSLCKQIVALHGGTIEATSTEGAGSTFSFTIPFGVVASDAPINVDFTPTTLSHAEQKSDAVDLLLSRHCHILIVDDVSSNRKILKMLLARTGAAIDMAENGQEAVAKVQQMLDNNSYNLGGYDIVFMDNLMPVMDGVEATRRLRANGYKNLVIGVTGNVLDDDVIEFLAAGADIVLGKPVKMTLLSTILHHFKNEGSLSRPGMTLVEEQQTLVWRTKEREA